MQQFGRSRATRRLAAITCVALAAFGATAAAAPVTTDGSTPAPASIERLVTTVPQTTLDTVGRGSIHDRRFTTKRLHGKALTMRGRPQLLVGTLAWCPHCAAANFGISIALSRFGTLQGLSIINTGPYFISLPNVNGLSFSRATFASPLIGFTDVILQDNSAPPQPFEKPTRAEQLEFGRVDKQNGFPVVIVGGRYGFSGIPFDPSVIQGKSAADTARLLADPKTPVAKAIDGYANLLTAAICTTTAQQPIAVCTSPAVEAAARGL
ncbi:MAG TPA: DUF929 family protein [Solirubrobacteraceae bacterium]|jgi:hypothetical protein|nr:DUF929 family protein [Solirubrobacteraceae bacterium]